MIFFTDDIRRMKRTGNDNDCRTNLVKESAVEIIDDALELLEKSIERKEADVFLLGVFNLQEGTARVSYNHRDDLVGDSGGHF